MLHSESVTSSPELSWGVCLKNDELGCQCSTCERHKQIHLVGTAQQSRILALLVCAATAQSSRDRALWGLCHQPLWSQGHSHSVINTGSSHFLNCLHLETISGSLLPFHHETRTCNRFFPGLVFFPPYSLFLDILSTRAILQGIREDGYICGVWICYICVLSL